MDENPKTQLIRDCAAVSAGTLAHLTDKHTYAEIDQLRAAWLRWIEQLEQPEQYTTWQAAFNAWYAERAAALAFDEAWPEEESAVDATREDSHVNWDAYFATQRVED